MPLCTKKFKYNFILQLQKIYYTDKKRTFHHTDANIIVSLTTIYVLFPCTQTEYKPIVVDTKICTQQYKTNTAFQVVWVKLLLLLKKS